MTERRRPGRKAPALHCLAVALAWSVGGGPAVAQSALRIATEGAYPPFNYVENNEPAGFEIDLARALCAAMKLDCTIQLQDWDAMYGGLKEKKYDAIVSSMEVTEERARRYTFSRPYYRIPAALVARKDVGPERTVRPLDLVGRSVGVVADSEFAAYLEELPKRPDIRTYGKLDEAGLDLLTGRIDYVLGDKLALFRFLDTREGKTCCRYANDLPVDRGGGVAIAMRKGDRGLAEMFNAGLDAVVADGTYDRIRAKYLPFDVK